MCIKPMKNQWICLVLVRIARQVARRFFISTSLRRRELQTRSRCPEVGLGILFSSSDRCDLWWRDVLRGRFVIEFLVSRGLFRNSEFNFWTPRTVWRHVLRGRFVIECLVSKGRFSTPRLARDREKARRNFWSPGLMGGLAGGRVRSRNRRGIPKKKSRSQDIGTRSYSTYYI